MSVLNSDLDIESLAMITPWVLLRRQLVHVHDDAVLDVLEELRDVQQRLMLRVAHGAHRHRGGAVDSGSPPPTIPPPTVRTALVVVDTQRHRRGSRDRCAATLQHASESPAEPWVLRPGTTAVRLLTPSSETRLEMVTRWSG